MKKTILLSVAVLSLLLSACGNSSTSNEAVPAIDTTKLKTGDAYYQCEMHPEVISDKPGACPKCEGMDMEKKVKK